METLLKANGIDLTQPLQILYSGKWTDCEIGRIFPNEIGVYCGPDNNKVHCWIRKEYIETLRNTPLLWVSFCHLSSSYWHYALWQKLFDLYRENGGKLDYLNDLLLDLKLCEQTCKRALNGEPTTFFFSFTSGSNITFWDSEYRSIGGALTFKVTVSKDGARFEQIK